MADLASLTVLQSFGALTSGGVALIASQGRSIDTIVPNVVMEETGTDTLSTTDHPVETGAAISDHSFRNPAELEMRVMWSDSTAQSVGYSIAVYGELQALQSTRQPFPIQTGKRSYSNMLFRTLTQRTDPTSEYSLSVVATFREIIIVNSASSSTSSTTRPSPSSDPSAQTDPQQTAPSTDTGASTSVGTIDPDSSTVFGNMGVDGTGNSPITQSGVSGAQVDQPLDGTSVAPPNQGGSLIGNTPGEAAPGVTVLPPVQISR